MASSDDQVIAVTYTYKRGRQIHNRVIHFHEADMLIKNQYDENIKFSAASIKQLNLLQRRIH